MHIVLTGVFVNDQNEALKFYTETLIPEVQSRQIHPWGSPA